MRLSKNREIRVIDRTIPEVYLLNKRTSRLDIIELCWMLKEMGVDLLEINSEILKKIGKPPAGIDFLYRTGVEDTKIESLPTSIKHCIVSAEALKETEFIKMLYDKKFSITAEYKIDGIERLDKLKRLKNTSYFKFIDCIRITGLNKCFSLNWTKVLKQVRNVLGIGIDICPENNYYCGTAIAIEALMEGMDSVTATFTGCGKERRFGALEEILAGIKVLISSEAKMNLRKLPQLSNCFTKVTGLNIHYSKPIVGKGIFIYEAGIHADGIEKNPLTYEPFQPDIVGQKRELALGKHSGTRAVIVKLKELGIQYSIERIGEILSCIKEKSISVGRSLLDDEILEICKYI